MKKILLIMCVGFIIRLVSISFFGNLYNNYYWEYGEIAKNIIHGNGYSLLYFKESKLDHFYQRKIKPSPSAYMPPGYVGFILPFMFIKNDFYRNILIIFAQILFSTITIYLIYIFSRKVFNESVALISAIILAFTPEFIYADMSYSPTVLYHLLVMLLFLSLLKPVQNKLNMFGAGLIVAAIIYLRAEFVLFFIILLFYTVPIKKWTHVLVLFITVLFLLAPWSIRNYLVFNTFVPLTTSFGLNLYRGNNPYGLGDWGDDKITEEIKEKTQHQSLELAMNRSYLDYTLNFIKDNPWKIIMNLPIKTFQFCFFFPKDQRSLHPLYMLPAIMLFVLFVYGLWASFSWKRYQLFYLFLIYSFLVAIVFCPLPRYQTLMKIMLIPFCAYGVVLIYEKIQIMLKRNGS